jgi:hypothetical protein
MTPIWTIRLIIVLGWFEMIVLRFLLKFDWLKCEHVLLSSYCFNLYLLISLLWCCRREYNFDFLIPKFACILISRVSWFLCQIVCSVKDWFQGLLFICFNNINWLLRIYVLVRFTQFVRDSNFKTFTHSHISLHLFYSSSVIKILVGYKF